MYHPLSSSLTDELCVLLSAATTILRSLGTMEAGFVQESIFLGSVVLLM